MEILDNYKSIKGFYSSEIKIKGSRFISSVNYVTCREEAEEFIQQIRSKYYDATHNCFAYRIGWDNNEFRYSDDGEPSGSAGKPILLSIDKYGYSDIVSVVTRYFGGTKLGVGGLIRAYSESSEKSLEICDSKEIHLTRNITIETGYEEISAMKRLIDEYAVDFNEEYTDKVLFSLYVHSSKIEDLKRNIINSTLGKAKININNSIHKIIK